MIRPRKSNDHDYSILLKKGELKTLSPGMKYAIYEDEMEIYMGKLYVRHLI